MFGFERLFKPKIEQRSIQNTSEWINYLKNATTVSSDDGVLSIATAYRCIAVISETIGSINGDVSRKVGDRTDKPEHSLNSVLFKKANTYVNAYNFKRQLVMDYLLRGNGYALIERNADGSVASLTNKRLNPVLVDKYWFYHDLESDQVYDYEDVIHILDSNSLTSKYTLTGQSRIRQHALTFGKAKTSLEYENKLYSSNLNLGGVLSFPETVKLTPEQASERGSRIKNEFGGIDNINKILVTDMGSNFKQLENTMPLADMEYILSQHFTTEEICRIFGVPPFKVFHFNKMTYDNMETMKVEFVESCILPIIIQFEQEIEDKCFRPIEKVKNFSINFDLKSLLRADLKTQTEYLTKMIGIGKYTINEIREMDGLNPVDGGDKPLIMANNLFPLDRMDELADAKIESLKGNHSDPNQLNQNNDKGGGQNNE